MTATYSYRTVDLRSNAVLEDIDLRGVQFDTKLNGQGSLDASLYVPPSMKGHLLDAATIPGRTGLYVLRNSIPVWGGIIWKRDWNEETFTFRLTCASWESYAYHRIQRLNKTYTSTDQIQIGRDLLVDPSPSIVSQSGIEPPDNFTSHMPRQRYMYGYEFKTVGAELEALSGLENSFDYRVYNYIKNDGSFGRKYLFGYPRLGANANVTDPNSLTFDYPGNLAPFGLSEDAENGGWRIYSVGSGEGSAMLYSAVQAALYDAQGWPLLDIVTSYKSVSVQATLDSHAVSDLISSLPPINHWTLALSPDSDVAISDFSVGDSAVFRLSSRRWTDPVVFVARIVQVTVHPGDPGALELVEIALADPVVGHDVTDPESQPDPVTTSTT